MFYNNIYAATYKYSRFKTEAPRFSAACVVTVCQIVLLFMILILLKITGVVNILGLLPSKYYFIPVFILWLIVVYKYYTKERTEKILRRYEQKPLVHRRLWSLIVISSFVIPIVIIALLLKK